MNCTSVIIVGKMTEQSWKVSKKLHFCWLFTHGLAISEPFKIKSWNFQRLHIVKRYIDNLYFGNHSWKNDWAELEIIIFLYFFNHPHQVLKFLYRSRWKAEIFTVNINWINNLIICTSVIRVGKWPSRVETYSISNIFSDLPHIDLPFLIRSRWKVEIAKSEVIYW